MHHLAANAHGSHRPRTAATVLSPQDKLSLQGKAIKEAISDNSGLETHTNQQFWFLQQAMSKLEQKMIVMGKRAKGSGPPSSPPHRGHKALRNVQAVTALAHPRAKTPGSVAEVGRRLDEGRNACCRAW